MGWSNATNGKGMFFVWFVKCMAFVGCAGCGVCGYVEYAWGVRGGVCEVCGVCGVWGVYRMCGVRECPACAMSVWFVGRMGFVRYVGDRGMWKCGERGAIEAGEWNPAPPHIFFFTRVSIEFDSAGLNSLSLVA